MWIIAPDAASVLSVVALDATKFPAVAERHSATDPDTRYVVLRMRVRVDMEKTLEMLAAACDVPVPLMDIDDTADYKYRSVVPADFLSMYLAAEVESIDYTSHFKEASVKRSPKLDKRYGALLSIWSSQERLQDTPAYSGRRWAAGVKTFNGYAAPAQLASIPADDDLAPLKLDYSTLTGWDPLPSELDTVDEDLQHADSCAFYEYGPCDCGARAEYDSISKEESVWDEYPSLRPDFSAYRAATQTRTGEVAQPRQTAERRRKRQRKQSKARRGQGRG